MANEDAVSDASVDAGSAPDPAYALLSRQGGSGLKGQRSGLTMAQISGLQSLASLYKDGATPPPSGPDMSQPSSISYNVHGAPMGGPGGNDRGGWTNVPLDANRQPVGSPQSRAQPAQPQATLAGQPAPNQQLGGQSPATPTPQPSPNSAPEARNGQQPAGLQGGLMQPPQMPKAPTPVDYDARVKKMFPGLTPMEHAQAVATMAATNKPIEDLQHRHYEEQLQQYDRQQKVFNALVRGDAKAHQDAVKETASITKTAVSEIGRAQKENEKLSKELADLGATPDSGEAKAGEMKKGKEGGFFGGGSKPDEVGAARIMELVNHYKTNQGIIDEAKKRIMGEVQLHHGAMTAAAKMKDQKDAAGKAALDKAGAIPAPASVGVPGMPPATPAEDGGLFGPTPSLHELGQRLKQPTKYGSNAPHAALEPGKTQMDGHVYLGGDPAQKKSWAKLNLEQAEA